MVGAVDRWRPPQLVLMIGHRAGVTDSALTNHGMAQIDRLAEHIVSGKVCEPSQIKRVFSSDLQRARKTAEGICTALSAKPDQKGLRPILTGALRERDFGNMEGERSMDSYELSNPSIGGEHFQAWKDCETESSMRSRVESFFNEHLRSMLDLEFHESDHEYDKKQAVIVVAHGIILRVLWEYLLGLFNPEDVGFNLHQHSTLPRDNCRPPWSNTGFLNLLIAPSTPKPQPPPLSQMPGWHMEIQAFNYTEHLTGLRRTRGGIGSAMHDRKQKQIKDFFH